jgi:hypothetical protein
MEVHCDTCLATFTDNISYEIHLKLLKCNKDGNKNYYCPVCDRQFRLLSNLQRHQETITHQELQDKIIKNENIITEDNTIKTISVDLTPRRKELSLEEMDKLNQEKQIKFNDEKMYDQEINNRQINDDIQVKYKDDNDTNTDIFLIQLKKQRELDLLPYTQSQPKTISIENSQLNVKTKIDENSKVNEKQQIINVSNIYTTEDPGFNLSLELQKTKNLLNEKTDNYSSQDYNSEDDFLNIFKMKQKELQKDKDKEVSIIKNEKKEVKKQPQQITKTIPNNNTTINVHNNLYPYEFKNTSVWNKLSELIKKNISNPDINIIATRFILSLLVNAPLSEYLIICTYAYYSEDLDKYKEVRISLIKGMLEVYNNYIKLAKNRQIFWNNKNVLIAINMMNNWKIELFLQNLIK